MRVSLSHHLPPEKLSLELQGIGPGPLYMPSTCPWVSCKSHEWIKEVVAFLPCHWPPCAAHFVLLPPCPRGLL